LFPLYATDVVDTGGKFAAGIIDTGVKFATGIRWQIVADLPPKIQNGPNGIL
jgi:hypothetical protein